jgi:hypothetical protein
VDPDGGVGIVTRGQAHRHVRFGAQLDALLAAAIERLRLDRHASDQHKPAAPPSFSQ